MTNVVRKYKAKRILYAGFFTLFLGAMTTRSVVGESQQLLGMNGADVTPDADVM